jgi:hypothetical protein
MFGVTVLVDPGFTVMMSVSVSTSHVPFIISLT